MASLESMRYYDSLRISTNSDFNDFLKRYPPDTLTEYDWLRLTIQGCFSNVKLIEKYADKLDWEMLLSRQSVSEEMLEKYSKYIHWFTASYYQKLSWEFIKKHKKDLSFEELIKNEKLSSYTLEKCKEMYLKLIEEDERWVEHWKNIRQTSSLYRDKSKPRLKEIPDIFTGKKPKKKILKENIPEEQEVISETPAEVNQEKPKRTRLTEKKILQMSKAECKVELDKRKIRYLYKNTLPELREMLLGTLKKKEN